MSRDGRRDVDVAAFRSTMGAFATGVTVVTTVAHDELYGMTVNSFSSVSLDPPLVLICVNKSSRGHRLIRRSAVLSVNVLAAAQTDLARRFADRDRPRGWQALAGVPFGWGANGCPVIEGSAAHVDCKVRRIHVAGDHVIVVGAVIGMSIAPDAAPLLFHRGRYRVLADAELNSPASPALTVR